MKEGEKHEEGKQEMTDSFEGDEDDMPETDDEIDEWTNDDDEDDDDDDDDDGISEDEDEEQEERNNISESHIISEMKEMWQQHLIAVLVAVIATFFVHRHINHAVTSKYTKVELEKHSFLVDFKRTANFSFCGIQNLQLERAGELQVFEFGLSKEHISSIIRHLAADVMQDDKYERVFEESFVVDKVQGMDDFQCLQRQNDSQSLRLKGHSHFYPSPPVHTMYSDKVHNKESLALARSVKNPSELKPVYLTFTGFAVKVINLSRKPVLLYWEGQTRRFVGEIGPYLSVGTASQSSGQTFSVTSVEDSESQLHQWIVTADHPIVYYDPREEKGQRSAQEQKRYQMIQLSKQYEMEYSLVAKRPWLANFPRPLPVHHFWPANFFGQTHNFDNEGKTFQMTVASVTPRVFTIPNFLSKQECNQLLEQAKTEGLKPSTLQSGTRARQQRDKSSRSSSNTWLPRYTSEVVETIYRRAAHLLQIDESLLQKKANDILHAHEHSLAESLQVVRYKESEEYTAHHDFVYPPTFHRHQPTRFATVLLYLNDDFEGGESVFPRAANARFHEGITIKPRRGTAVLFYNMLPDGNMDDLSQHSSQPIERGEKWLANLWVWEPHIF